MTASNQIVGSSNAVAAISCEGTNGVGINLVSSSWSGTLAFQASMDGINWFGVAAYPILSSTGLLGSPVLTTTAAGAFNVPTYGFAQVRVLATVYTSGSMLVTLEPSDSAAPGATFVNHEGQKATYSYAVFNHTPAATPTDWFTILGSSTRTVKLVRLRVRLRATAAAHYRVGLKKYSTVYTAGTPAAVTAVPHDSTDQAATAVVQTWSGGLPTVGTLVGAITDENLPVMVGGTPTFGWIDMLAGVAGDGPLKYPTLRGVGQYLALNSSAVALGAGSAFDVHATITEE